MEEQKDKIRITTAVKGNKTVVMYKKEYEIEMKKLLNDKTLYKKSRNDPTAKLEMYC